MARIVFNSSYTPCGFSIVRKGCDEYDEDTKNARLIQADWDAPGVASTMGWTPCKKCYHTDGTVDCKHKTASQMISEADDCLREHAGEEFDALDEYLQGE